MTIENIEIEKPKRNEVLVRTRVSGLCHSDLHFIEGKYPTPVPAVLGHCGGGGRRRHQRQAWGPCSHLLVGVLWPL